MKQQEKKEREEDESYMQNSMQQSWHVNQCQKSSKFNDGGGEA